MCPNEQTSRQPIPTTCNFKHFDVAGCNARQLYQLLTSGVVPRPIAWISTVNEHGVSNLAPFSFFTVVSIDPPILAITQVYPGKDRINKDTLRNLLTTKECIVNVVSEENAAFMNGTCADYPYGVSEFDALKIQSVRGMHVDVPGVASSSIRFECKLRETVDIGNGRLVLLDVIHIVAAHDILHEDGVSIDNTRTNIIGRLGGDAYTKVHDQIEMTRPTLN